MLIEYFDPSNSSEFSKNTFFIYNKINKKVSIIGYELEVPILFEYENIGNNSYHITGIKKIFDKNTSLEIILNYEK